APLVAREGVARPDLHLPSLLPVLDVEGEKVFLALTGAHDVKPVANDRRAGVAGTRTLEGPRQRRPVPRPLLEKALFRRDIIASRALPLRPVGAKQRRGEQDKDERPGSVHPCASRGSRRTDWKSVLRPARFVVTLALLVVIDRWSGCRSRRSNPDRADKAGHWQPPDASRSRRSDCGYSTPSGS